MAWKKRSTMLEQHDHTVEVVAHKNATKRQVKNVKKANDILNNLFEDNHFTIKLYLAQKD